MIATIQELNQYLLNRFEADSWVVVPESKIELTGKVSCYGTLYEIVGVGTEFHKLEIGNIVAIQNTLYKIKDIVSPTKVKIFPVDSIPNFSGESVYLCTENDYAKQNKILKAFSTAEKQMLSAQDWIIPVNSTSQNVKEALFEWTFWLLNGGKSEAKKDIEQGITSKKIDVLQWNYSDKYTKPSTPEVWALLAQFENPNYYEGEVIDTSFSMQ